ncbi:TPA: hypothetical protein DIC20_00920 [Candidatus Dependentiae bacterium]|nr:hypothetical protein [Candidatus Dependentiae bacterium]HCU00249.1 hypothetical protein [Candidatus Dependentiae bacterium]
MRSAKPFETLAMLVPQGERAKSNSTFIIKLFMVNNFLIINMNINMGKIKLFRKRSNIKIKFHNFILICAFDETLRIAIHGSLRANAKKGNPI